MHGVTHPPLFTHKGIRRVFEGDDEEQNRGI